MASETKRPERPVRRKSDIPLETNRFLDHSSPQSHGQAAKVGSDMTCILGTFDGKDEEGAGAENLEDLCLQIVEESDLRPTRPAPPVPVVSGSSAQPAPRSVRPKDRHKTLSSQFPTVELRKKEEKVELGNRRCVEFLKPAVPSPDNHVSMGTAELSSPKPVIKPKPVFHGSGQPNVVHPSCSGQIVNCLVHKDAGHDVVVQGQSEISNPAPASQSGLEHSGDQPNNAQTTGQKSSSQESTGQQSSGQQNTGQKAISENSSHEAVPKPQPKIPVSSEENVLQTASSVPNAAVSEPEAQDADGPVYAQVDKTRKMKKRASYDDQVQSSGHMRQNSDFTQKQSDLTRANTVDSSISGASSGASGAGASLVPPKKPPRTFAHTEYMRLKAMEREGRTGSPSISATAESEYEEIENPAMRSGKKGIDSSSNTDDRTNNSSLNQENAEPAKSDPVKRRSTGDKLPAPPRPPPPSIVQKTGTLPAKKNGESSPVAEAFQRGSPNFRNSDRSFFRDKRKSKSPEPLKVGVQQKKPSEKKPNNEKKPSDKKPGDARSFRGKLEEDIYAEPDEVRRKGLSPAVESPIDDPLYEVPGTANRSRSSNAAADACGYAIPEARKNPTRQVINHEHVSFSCCIISLSLLLLFPVFA